MDSTILLAAISTAEAAKTAATHAVPPGLQTALAHVPSASEAMEVLKQHLAAYTQAVAAVIRHGLHLGLGK